MAAKTFEDILHQIRSKVLHPVYFLMGEEPFYIDMISDYLEDTVLSKEEKEFNLSIIYGKETDIQDIINHARRFPMMGSYHLVIVKEAQNIKDFDGLIPYVQKPLQSTILVICYKYKSYDRRKKVIKEFEKTGVVFEGKKLYDNQIPAWIESHIKQKGYRIGPRAVQLLANHLGSDLGKIVNELEKVFINLKAGAEVTEELIERNIGISKEFNVFEFEEALSEKNKLKAFQIVRYFADNPKSSPLVLTLGVLYQFFSRVLIYHSLHDKSRNSVVAALSINGFFLPKYQRAAKNYHPDKIVGIISFLRDCDTRSKGINNSTTTEGELLKELTYRILR